MMVSNLHIAAAQPPKTSKEVLLCLHASATSGRAWAALTAPLAPTFSVVTPDRLGCAREERWPTGQPASFDAEVRHLAHHLNALGGGVHLLAHSYGAAVGLELALRWPDLVRSLTLYEPVRFALLFDTPETEGEGAEILGVARTVAFWVMSGRLYDAARHFVDYWSGRGAWATIDGRRQQVIAASMPKVAAEFEAAFADRTPREDFEQLTMPLRLLCGSQSPAPTRRIVHELAGMIAHADVVELPGLGHMGPVTNPSLVLDQLPHWLAPGDLRDLRMAA